MAISGNGQGYFRMREIDQPLYNAGPALAQLRHDLLVRITRSCEITGIVRQIENDGRYMIGLARQCHGASNDRDVEIYVGAARCPLYRLNKRAVGGAVAENFA